jgi:RluA family pseudouridine synthase
MNNTIVRRLEAKGIAILYEDADILVINKPAPFLVLPDRFDPTISNLFSLLNEYYGKIYTVHRLDRETSGVILFAKTPEAHGILSQQFSAQEVDKKYCAIVHGTPEAKEGIIELPIGEGARGKMRIDHNNGKESATRYRLLEPFQGYSLLELQPLTGGTRQIRIHLSAIGMPILCDELYGDGKAFYLSSIKLSFKQTDEDEHPLLGRTALHAESLSIIHPASKEQQQFTAPLPKDMAIALKYLKKFRP